MAAYTKNTEYLFEVMDEILAVSWQQSDCLFVEQCRKNGQEDTHVRGYLSRDGDLWKWEQSEGGDELFACYHSQKFADAILAFVNANPVPVEENNDVG